MLQNLLSRPLALAALALAVVLVVLSLVVTTCHTKPSGILTRQQEGQLESQKDRALAAAAQAQAHAEAAHQSAQQARAAAQHYDSLATIYATHAHPVHTAATDTSGLAKFWAELFGR